MHEKDRGLNSTLPDTIGEREYTNYKAVYILYSRSRHCFGSLNPTEDYLVYLESEWYD